MDTLIGMDVAIGGSCLFGIGAAWQALEARAVPQEHALRAPLLRRLLARPRWLAGSLIASLSWPIHAAALTLAPLAVVQAADSVGLIVLLAVASRVLGLPRRHSRQRRCARRSPSSLPASRLWAGRGHSPRWPGTDGPPAHTVRRAVGCAGERHRRFQP
ncbi:MAG: hypothetical protein ACR2K9_04965 [Solirubrobacteraceae bacterium]